MKHRKKTFEEILEEINNPEVPIMYEPISRSTLLYYAVGLAYFAWAVILLRSGLESQALMVAVIGIIIATTKHIVRNTAMPVPAMTAIITLGVITLVVGAITMSEDFLFQGIITLLLGITTTLMGLFKSDQ